MNYWNSTKVHILMLKLEASGLLALSKEERKLLLDLLQGVYEIWQAEEDGPDEGDGPDFEG